VINLSDVLKQQNPSGPIDQENVKRIVNTVVQELQQKESLKILSYKRELKKAIERPQQAWNSIDAFMLGIQNLEKLAESVRADTEAARKESQEDRKTLADHLGLEIDLEEQLRDAEKKIEELQIQIDRLTGELNNAQTALDEAESDRGAAEAVGILSDEEVELKNQEKELVSTLGSYTTDIAETVIEINTCQAKIDLKKDLDTNEPIMVLIKKKLQTLGAKKSATEDALKQKRKEIAVAQRCPVCIKRKNSLSAGSQASDDSAIDMKSPKSGPALPPLPETGVEDNTASHSGKPK
jgi:hypothetical protein